MRAGPVGTVLVAFSRGFTDKLKSSSTRIWTCTSQEGAFTRHHKCWALLALPTLKNMRNMFLPLPTYPLNVILLQPRKAKF